MFYSIVGYLRPITDYTFKTTKRDDVEDSQYRERIILEETEMPVTPIWSLHIEYKYQIIIIYSINKYKYYMSIKEKRKISGPRIFWNMKNVQHFPSAIFCCFHLVNLRVVM